MEKHGIAITCEMASIKDTGCVKDRVLLSGVCKRRVSLIFRVDDLLCDIEAEDLVQFAHIVAEQRQIHLRRKTRSPRSA